ncbi:MAG: hypothetical protein H6659_00900 [Ardenticatenaceae bacterium]|nr:hypothetical protein [Ardenticatenaceae bacterium]MCB8986310.1 hypothetical protein [Ardenticatenaceae bacterium]
MKEYVSDLYDKIKGESSGLGNLLEKVPGLSGYMERSRRREADQILRETVSSQLETARLNLSNVHQELSRDIVKAMDYAEPLGRADNMLMGLIGKIKDAPQGYAGFFDAVKVKEEDLARLYAFDESMLNHVDEVNASIDALQKAVRDDGDINSTIRRLTTVLQAANQDFANRNEVLMGIE